MQFSHPSYGHTCLKYKEIALFLARHISFSAKTYKIRFSSTSHTSPQ